MRPTARRAMTLVEVLLALAVTSMVALTVLGVLAGLGSLASNEQAGRLHTTQREAGAMRLAAAIRASGMVLDADAGTIVLWKSDSDGNGQPNLSEILRLARPAEGSGVMAYQAPPGLDPADDATWPLGSGFLAITHSLADGPTLPGRLLAPGVVALTIGELPTDPMQATLVRFALSYEWNSGTILTHVDATPRARASLSP